MKRIIIIALLIAVRAIDGHGEVAVTPDDADRRVTNCAVMVGTAIDMVFNNQHVFDVRTYADTLYHDLYTNPVELKTGAKYLGKLCLQAFFALSEDTRIDYPDIERCLAVTGKHEAFYTLPFIVCAYYYSQWAEQQQLTDKQIAAMQLGLKAHDKLYPDSTTFFSQAMNLGLSSTFYQQKNWRGAAKYTERLLKDQQRLGNADTDEYFEMLSAFASCLHLSGRYAKADSCLRLVQRHMEQGGRTGDEEYVEVLIDRAGLLQSLGNNSEAEQMLLLARKGLTDADEAYHEVMRELADVYTGEQQYEKALGVLKQELSCFEKMPSPQVEMLFPWIVLCDNPLSTNEDRRLIALLEKKQDGSVKSMSVLAYAYCHDYQYEKANAMVPRMEQAYGKLTSEEKEGLIDYLQPLYTALNDFDRLVELQKLQAASIEKVVGNRHDLYAQTVALQAKTLSLKGDYMQSIQLLDSCLHVPDIDLSTQIDIYAELAGIYSSLGDYQKSNRYASTLLKYTEDVPMRHRLMSCIVVNLISELEIRRLDADEQGKADTDSLQHLLVDYAARSLDFCRSHFGEGHLNTIEAMEYLASAYYLSNDTLRMKDAAESCEQTIRRHLKNPTLQRTYLQGLSVFYQKCRQYQKAIELVDTTCLQKQNAIAAEIRGTLEPLAELSLDLGRYTQAQHYFTRLAKAIIGETSAQMSTLTSQARQYYWRLSRQTLSGAGKYVSNTGQQDAFAGTIYDLALYTKDIMLGSEMGFVRAVRSTGNQTLTDKLQQLLNIRTALVQSTAMTDEEWTAKSRYAQALEQELIAACKDSLKAGLDGQLPDWRQIRQALPDSSMAIEMVQYKSRDETERYGAVLLRKEWAAPVFVQMGTKSQFEAILPQDLSAATGQLVWQFMKPYMSALRTIYFSPIGVFHKLPVEYLPFDGHKVLSEDLHVHRMSSTSQLLSPHYDRGRDAVVYGGLEYAMSVKEMEQDAKRHRGAADVEALPYLKGTAIEADSIVTLINGARQEGMSALCYSGKEGTEASFKALSGQHKRIVHIGTHGSYAPEESQESYSPLIPNARQHVNNEDRALMRSWLSLAGADNRLNDEMIPEGVDDGQLTAQEISTLDLRGLDLVTLSACQTAQGRITGDGVFGLQRGFKKAGAQSILMSLWKVDDEATCLLMTEFYRNWIAGKMTKHEALEQAKKVVRSHKECGWDDPKYWAAFILLDALD